MSSSVAFAERPAPGEDPGFGQFVDRQLGESADVGQIAAIIAPLRADLTDVALTTCHTLYRIDENGLLSGRWHTAEQLAKFAKSDAAEIALNRNPSAVALLTSAANQQSGVLHELSPDDLAIYTMSSDLFLSARRQVIVEAVAKNPRKMPQSRYDALKSVASELSKKGRSPIAQAYLDAERDRYSGYLLRKTVNNAANHGAASPEFSRLGTAYQIVADGKDPNVIRRAVSASLDAMHTILRKGESATGHLDAAVNELRTAIKQGSATKASTDYDLYETFAGVVGRARDDIAYDLAYGTDDSLAKRSSDEHKRQLLDSLKKLNESMGWQVTESGELNPEKPTAAASMYVGQPPVNLLPRKSGERIRLLSSPDDEIGGTMLTRRYPTAAATAALAAVVVGTVASPALAAGGQSTAPESTSQVSDQAPQTTVEVGNYVVKTVGSESNDSESVIPSDPPASAPTTSPEQASTDTTPSSTTESTTPDAPATTDTPESTPSQTATTDTSEQTTTDGPGAPVETNPPATPSASEVVIGNAVGGAEQGNSEVIKTEPQELKDYILGSQYFDRTGAYAKFRELMNYPAAPPVTVGNDAPPEADRQLLAQQLANGDALFNDHNADMTDPARLNYVMRTLSAQAVLDEPDFLNKPRRIDFLVTHGEAFDAARQILQEQYGDLEAHIGSTRSDAFLDLMASAEVGMMSDHDKAALIEMVGLNQHKHNHHPSNHHHANHHHSGHHRHHNRVHHHTGQHEAGPNLEGLSSEQVRGVEAIFRYTQGQPHLRLAMLVGGHLESSWLPGAVGVTSYGIFQIQDPGNPDGPHPDISIAQAKDPEYATRYMLANYKGAVASISDTLWRLHPMAAAELAAYRAEKPKYIYHESRGWGTVVEAFNASEHVLSKSNRPGHPAHHNPDHAHSSDGYASLRDKIVHYPGVHNIVSQTDTHVPIPDMMGGFVYYNQWDVRWGTKQYNAPDHTATVESGGCEPTSTAMILSSLTGENIYPYEISTWFQSHGYRADNGSVHQGVIAAAENWGLKAEYIGHDIESIKNILAQGGLVAIEGKDYDLSTPPTSAGHIYVIRGVTPDGRFIVSDPNSVVKSMQTWDANQMLSVSNMVIGVTK